MKCLIDGDHIIYIVTHNKKLYEEDGSPKLNELGEQMFETKTLAEMKDQADEYIKNIFRQTKASEFILALTVGRCFRYEIYPEYKANRKAFIKPAYYDQIKEHLIVKWKAFYMSNLYEADDIICSYKKIHGADSTIVSTDKDLLKCIVGSHYNSYKNEFIAVSSYDAEHDFWKSVICGDVSDNIKGLVGKGAAFWSKLVLDNPGEKLSKLVFGAYIDLYEVDYAIDEYYKNYRVLRLVDNIPDLPELLKVGDYI